MENAIDAPHLLAECENWRNSLRTNRDHLTSLANKLLEIASKQTSDKEFLQEVGHYQNQFDIQLVNVHDVKRAVKDLEKKLEWETKNDGQYSESSLNDHRAIEEQYKLLQETLKELQDSFNDFTKVFQP